jgi:hypothetical protein
VQVKDQIQEGDDHFVIFEYVDGADMKHLIAAARERRDDRYSAQYGSRLPTELAVHIVREVCNALEYAHDLEDTDQGLPLNIVHRDISPQNVLISFDGEVKLTDFGIAKARDSGEHTQVGVVKGKYTYMSPEQILGQPLDRTSDLYSLGIVLYEAVVGEKLYSGDSDFELQRRVVRGGIDREKLEAPAVPPGLRRILGKALQTDRNRRYQSGAEMAADLAEFTAGQHSLDRALSQYMHSAFRQTVVSQSESTVTVDAVAAQGSPGKRAATGRPEGPSPVAATQANSAPTEGERTIIDIIRITAYSGRRFFAIGGASAVVVLLALLAVDVFGTHYTAIGRNIHYMLFPPSAMLYSVPSGAEVMVDGKKLPERTPARLTTTPGSHEVIVRLSGFEWEPKQIKITPDGGKVQAETLRSQVPVFVRTHPEGATVIWDGRERGKTPFNDAIRTAVGDQPVRVQFALAGFETLSFSLDLSKMEPYAANQFVDVASKPSSAGTTSLEVDGTFYGVWRFNVSPANAQVHIDDSTSVPLGQDGSATMCVKYGSHTATAQKEGFFPDNKPLNVTTGETLTVGLRCRRRVQVEVYDAEGERVRKASVTIEGITHYSDEPFYLSVGPHSTVVKAEGYDTQTKTVNVTDGGEPRFSVTLQRGAKPITIVVLKNGVPVSGATVIAARDPQEGGGGGTLDQVTDAAGECRTSTDKLLGRYRFDVQTTDEGRKSDSTWHDIRWNGDPLIKVNIQ